MKRWFRNKLQKLIRKHILPQIPVPREPETLISKVARFTACEMIEGDYLEFGVYRGGSFISAYKAFARQFENRIRQNSGGIKEEENRENRRRIWNQMRFFAFDSFEGLPALTEEDAKSQDFQQGQYACSESQFLEIITKAGVPSSVTRIVPGWFSDSCNAQTIQTHAIKKAAVVWIDCDLYSSTKTVLEFITPLLQDGTILIFDDWFSYKGSPYAGEQKAFYEWIKSISSRFTAQEYQKEKWKRASFILSEKTTAHD